MGKKRLSQKIIGLFCSISLLGVLSPITLVNAEETEQISQQSTTETSVEESSTSTEQSTIESSETPDKESSNKTEEFNFTILHTNDMHGRMQYEDGKVIGLAKLKTFKELKNPTLMLDSGDAMQGLAISNFGKGMDMAKAMSQLPYDAVGVGNHEFDFGYNQAMAYKEVLPMVSANVEKDAKSSFEPYKIIEKDGKKFAVIGLSTPETAFKTHPNNVKGVTFKDPIPVAKEMINSLKGQADVFIFLSHLGMDDTTPDKWRGDKLAETLSTTYPDEKIIVLDGHSHTALPSGKTYGNVLLAQTGNHLNNVGYVTVDYKNNKPTYKAELIPATEFKDIEEDATVKKVVDETKVKFDSEMGQTVIENNPIKFDGSRENARTRETNLGNIIADSLYNYGQTGFKNGQTDVAVINGGGIRTDINKGKVTKGDILAVLPFGNTIAQIDVTGKQLKEMFEYSLRSDIQKDESGNPIVDDITKQPLLGQNGGFLQVSDSVKINYDPAKQGAGNEATDNQVGQRIWSIKIKNKTTEEFEPIVEDKTYKLATNDFLAAGGDGYTMLGGAREEGPSLDEVFTEFLNNIVTGTKEKVTALSAVKYDMAHYENPTPYERIIPGKMEITEKETPLEELETTIKESQKLIESDYTAQSWSVFNKALVVAEKVLSEKDESAAQETNSALLKAKEQLVSIKTLTQLVAEAEKLKESDYTKDSWNNLVKNVKEAKTILKDAKVVESQITKETVNEVESNLNKAMKKLVKNTTGTKKETGGNLPKTGETVSKFVRVGLMLTTIASAVYVFKNKAS